MMQMKIANWSIFFYTLCLCSHSSLPFFSLPTRKPVASLHHLTLFCHHFSLLAAREGRCLERWLEKKKKKEKRAKFWYFYGQVSSCLLLPAANGWVQCADFCRKLQETLSVCACVCCCCCRRRNLFLPSTSASLVAQLGFLSTRCDARVKRHESRFSFMKLSHFVPAAERHSGLWIIHAGHRHLPRSRREKPLLTTEGMEGAEQKEEQEEEEELLPHRHFEKNRWHFRFTDGPNGTFYRPDLKATFPPSAVRVDHFLKKYITKWLTVD